MNNRLKIFLSSLILLSLVLTACGNLAATSGTEEPAVISLPNGFQPDGIASGNGTTFYVGCSLSGAIFHGDVRTGELELLVDEQRDRIAVGLKYDPRSGLLFVAGGDSGSAYIYDGETGENVAEIELTTTAPSFINDVVITRHAAYFTDSQQPVLYKVLLENNGELPDEPIVEEMILGGDYDFAQGEFNANGIDATPDGTVLLMVNTFDGILYNVHPTTGVAKKIDLGASILEHADGLLLKEKILYAVQNTLNQIAVIELNSDFSSGTIVDTITSPSFHLPTTLAGIGDAVYAVNARFGTDPTADTDYEVIRVPIE